MKLTFEERKPAWLKGVNPKTLIAILRIADEKGSVSVGQFGGWTVRIRAVRCGKPNCHKCPHRFYAYAEKRIGGKLKTKYLGVVKIEGRR